MSERNVELHRRATEAFCARDLDATLAIADPNCEYHSTFTAIGGAVYHGHDGLRRWHRDLEDSWAEIRLEPEAYFDLGDHTLLVGMLHGRGRLSGVEVAMAGALVARWREGLMVFAKTYAHREDAVRDLGVSENELEPIEP